MLHRVLASITIKLAFAFLLMATAMVSSAGSLRCLLGLPMSGCITEKSPAALPTAKEDSCCHPKTLTAKQGKKSNECCCIQALKKPPTDGAPFVAVEFRFDFPILVEAPIRFDLGAVLATIEQVRIPNGHDPPGIVATSASPRAPPPV